VDELMHGHGGLRDEVFDRACGDAADAYAAPPCRELF